MADLTHYFDARLVVRPEDRAPFRQKLMTVLHRLIVQHGVGEYALAFPEIGGNQCEPGSVLRVFGSAEALELMLQSDEWKMLAFLSIVKKASIKPTPAVTQYVAYRRDRNYERGTKAGLSKRRARRKAWLASKGVTPDAEIGAQIERRTKDRSEVAKDLPFIGLKSGSTGFGFTLSIRKEEAPGPGDAAFGSYGLAIGQSAVPDF